MSIGKTTRKIIILSAMNLAMICFIIFMFYKSEPTYINNVNRIPALWDYVIVEWKDSYETTSMDGVVVQTDLNGFVIRYKPGLLNRSKDGGLYTIAFKGGNNYRIVGKGTFYHKVNNYVGFNIMLITTLIIIVFFIMVLRVEVLLVWSILEVDIDD